LPRKGGAVASVEFFVIFDVVFPHLASNAAKKKCVKLALVSYRPDHCVKREQPFVEQRDSIISKIGVR
jgi:hypothetical protein